MDWQAACKIHDCGCLWGESEGRGERKANFNFFKFIWNALFYLNNAVEVNRSKYSYLDFFCLFFFQIKKCPHAIVMKENQYYDRGNVGCFGNA